MSNLEKDPPELVCGAAASAVLDAPIELLEPRLVPLGGPRAMTVRRTLPQRARSLDRRLVLHRPLRAGRRGRDRRDGGAAAPAHRTADGELAVRRRDRAPGLLGRARDGAPGRAEPDDGRERHPALRGVDARPRRCCTACSCGPRYRMPPGTARRSSSGSCPPVFEFEGASVSVFLGSLLGHDSTRHRVHPDRRRAARSAGGHRAADSRSIAAFEHGVLVDTGEVEVDGVLVPSRAPGLPGTGRGDAGDPCRRPCRRASCCSAARRSASRS